MKIWLDDLRPMPEGFDLHCKTFTEAAYYISLGNVTFCSFDHDLGPEEAGTGYQLAEYIEEGAFLRIIPRMNWAIHSANPVGRKNIETAMKNAEKFWSQYESS